MSTAGHKRQVKVVLKVTNIDDYPVYVTGQSRELTDDQGHTAMGINASVQMEAKRTVVFAVQFEIPRSATPCQVELHDSIFSRGVKISLR
jgi:hypothetical protein